MPLEDIGAVEGLFSRRATARTETANHCALVMCKGMSVFVVLACKAFGVVLARGDGALLWPLVLVCEHVGLEVLEDASTFWQRAHALFACLIIHVVAATALAACAGVL